MTSTALFEVVTLAFGVVSGLLFLKQIYRILTTTAEALQLMQLLIEDCNDRLKSIQATLASREQR